eukprot:scaffold157503_cov28-Tisochrysis_lutea.AAC.1
MIPSSRISAVLLSTPAHTLSPAAVRRLPPAKAKALQKPRQRLFLAIQLAFNSPSKSVANPATPLSPHPSPCRLSLGIWDL